MEDIKLLLARLRSADRDTRLEACKQLSAVSSLSEEAINALRLASIDCDPNKSTKFPPNSSESAGAPSSSGNLDVGHWLFLIIGTSMLLDAALSGNWVATLIILLIMIAAGIILTVRNLGNN
jgi:hypothetical protein